MPLRVKVDYTLTAPDLIDIIRIDFDRSVSADLIRDFQAVPPPTYQSTNPPPGVDPYIIFPVNQFTHLFVFALAKLGAGEGLKFTMTVTFTMVNASFIQIPGTTPFSPPVTLEGILDATGKAIINTSVRWK